MQLTFKLDLQKPLLCLLFYFYVNSSCMCNYWEVRSVMLLMCLDFKGYFKYLTSERGFSPVEIELDLREVETS